MLLSILGLALSLCLIVYIYIYIYIGSFQIIASHLFRKFNCSYVQNQYFACHINETQRDSLPPIKITLGGKELSIPPNSYLLPTTQMQEPPYLEFTPLAIIIMNESFEYYPNWVLGVTFLQNFYTIFDYDNYAIAFVRYFYLIYIYD